MGMRITIDLDDDDLQHFRLIMRDARNTALQLSPEDIVSSAESLLAGVDPHKTPRFIMERLARLETMIRMLTDHEWRLPQKDSARVLNALAYFTDTEDLIPDQVPGIGYLDDAIIVELVVRELRHEIDAYDDFCEFRINHPRRRGIKSKTSDLTRDQWLDKRRKTLQERMKRRRKQDRPASGDRLL